ncbi:MAG: serine/threonine protein kinase [Myxococcaceae bacterium]|nr:serine/threonine protein kinase [Myxococcaceae bacterium]
MSGDVCPSCGEALSDGQCPACRDTRAETPNRSRKLREREVTQVSALAVGELLEERWRLTGVLRRGPLSTVYVADDLQTKAPAVVKSLSAALTRDTDAVQRFNRECQLLRELEHPHLVPLLGSGWRGVTPWVAMPRLEGHTLTDELDAGRLPHDRVLGVVRQLGAALQFLHDRGLVHRDVKPGNVFVGAGGHVTLLDLGLAHDALGPLLTRPGQKLGTVAYMAPEQIDGAPVDGRTDVYALGVVTFELLCGELPFDGREHEVLRAHQVAAPPSLTALEPRVPAGLSAAVQRAMAKAPADRFATVDDFVARVQLFLELPATAPVEPLRRR